VDDQLLTAKIDALENQIMRQQAEIMAMTEFITAYVCPRIDITPEDALGEIRHRKKRNYERLLHALEDRNPEQAARLDTSGQPPT
jgi:hypothetical protein